MCVYACTCGYWIQTGIVKMASAVRSLAVVLVCVILIVSLLQVEAAKKGER